MSHRKVQAGAAPRVASGGKIGLLTSCPIERYVANIGTVSNDPGDTDMRVNERVSLLATPDPGGEARQSERPSLYSGASTRIMTIILMERLTLSKPARMLVFNSSEVMEAGAPHYRRQLASRIKNDLEGLRISPSCSRSISEVFKFLAAAASLDPSNSEAAPGQTSPAH